MSDYRPNPAEIVRAGQKDEEYIESLLTSPVNELALKLFGECEFLYCFTDLHNLICV